MDTRLHALVVGAGPAGLAVAGSLRARGPAFELLEKSRLLAASWHGHYDSLRLHTDKRHSALPGLPYPADYPRYVTKGQFLDYLQDYADRFDIRPRWGEKAVSARWEGGFWELQTASDAYRARNLVVATGHTARPNVPDIPGLDDSPLTVVHSSGYRNAVPYRGKRVLVVGFGNSAGEIARDLYKGGASPALAVRGPVNVVPREFFGVPLLSVTVPFSLAPAAVVDAMSAPLIFAARGTLKGTGLEKPPYGPFTQAQKYGRVPLIDTGIIPLRRQKRVPKMPGVARVDGHLVVFDDGSSERFDVMVLATGFRPSAQAMFPPELGLFDELGVPRAFGGTPASQGLYFCGFHVVPTGMLREIFLEARKIGARIAADAR
jgi:indole-3-pyruvate monooxygenase